jgi:hypothetical protein
MRIPFLTAALLLIIASCNNPEKTSSLSMQGAYKMLSQTVKGGKTDTTFTSLQQQKIYTDDYMMYVQFNPLDSASSFGIGTYSIIMDTVTEHVFYNGSDSSKTETLRHYKLFIEKTPTGYKQVIPEIESQGVIFKMTENYETTTGTTITSPLDGAWQLEKQVHIKGKDSVINKLTQFKVYYAGHFIWGRTSADSTGKIHTAIGYGKFEMSEAGKVKESVAVSTYYQVRGQDVDIDIVMNGNDAFTQTTNNKDDSKSIEIYKRLKK